MRRFRTGRSGLPTAGSRFEPQRVALEDTHGHVLEELLQPRSSFKGHSLETPWNDLQLAYFAGCAMWTYLNTPFLLVRPGVESEEIEPWQEAGEAAAVRLDIHERELRVGLRVLRDATGEIVGQIFISDSLENGAGYSSYFGNPSEAESLLRFIAGETSTVFYAPIVGQSHAGNCQTSCPDCLRDFTNLSYHNILDWRLGLDLARLALDANAPLDFSVSYWQGVDATAAGSYFAAMPGWHRTTFGGLQAAHRGNQAQIITHPLWDPAIFCPQLASAHAEAVSAGC